jgi:starch synthase
MKILFTTSEAVPFCKTGGLGDVCGSLPIELARLGHDVSLVLPAFRHALHSGQPIENTGVTFEVPIGRKTVAGKFLRSRLPDSNVPVYLVQNDDYYDRPALYGEGVQDYKDNCERFTYFARAVLELISALDLGTELVHSHDWTSGLVPAYLKTELRGIPPFDSLRSIFTIHNLAYQGNFWHWDMELTGIDWKYFNWRQMEFYGNLSFLKSGLAFADVLTTVSPRYAKEIQSPPLGCGMEGILSHRHKDLVGIINGVDYTEWDPAIDPHLGGHNYNAETFAAGKAACKRALQQEIGLPVREDLPLVAFIGRLAEQKGFDILAEVMTSWAHSSPAQWVVLGTGDAVYHHMLTDLARRFGHKMAVRLEFSNPLAHRIEAGADIFVMPSRFEPCGLNQLYSLKYGTVPVVRATGGLADTIVDFSEQSRGDLRANGFTFEEYTSHALNTALQRAVDIFAMRPAWEQLIQNGMRQDWSWSKSARMYDELYQRVASAVAART